MSAPQFSPPPLEARIAGRVELNVLGQLTLILLHDAAGLSLWNGMDSDAVDEALRRRGFQDGDVIKLEAVR